MASSVFLTGASSGIGRATAELLAESGYKVWATSRDGTRLPAHPAIHPLALDLLDTASIDAAWNRAVAEAGEIDVLVQNAGAGIFGAIEDVTPEESAQQWKILVEGPLRLLQLAAAHMRPRRSGIIVGISSLAAEMPLPFAAHYSAGKAALSALLGGLHMELKPFNVNVVDLRPGDIKTAFNDALSPTQTTNPSYQPWTQPAWKETVELMNRSPEPELVAQCILSAIERPRALARCGTFFQARLGPLGVRILSRAALLDSIRKYYHLDGVDREMRK